MNRFVAVAIGVVLAACTAPGPSASAPAATSGPTPVAPPSVAPSQPSKLTATDLAARVGSEQIRPHLVAFQAIADANGGHRADGSPGFIASVAYVVERLEEAGYRVEQQPVGYRNNGVDHRTVNLVAERPGAGSDEVVMAGAHLDSVPVGPGINDNGSGVATLLAVAEALAAVERPHRSIRFAFWGAEESGQKGSQAYVAGLPAAERARIVAYLNFDVLGSPNLVRFVYSDAAAAPGSQAITDLFAAHFTVSGLAWEPIDLSGKTDHWPFAAAGIPTGGLFSGGIEPKTDAQAARHGGTAGQPADACSHRACDTLANVADRPLDEMADAVAGVLVTLVQAEELR